MWLVFSYAAYADLCAGLMSVILLCGLVSVFRDLRRGLPPTMGAGFRLGLVAIAVVYLRSSAALLVLAMGSATVLAAIAILRGRDRARALMSVAVAAATFVAVLLPWSVFASATLDGRVVATTSVSTGLGNTFGAKDELCFGPCDPGSTIWFNPLRYSREVARATGLSEMEVAGQMSEYARRDVTPHSYAEDVVANSARYAGFPAGFVRTLQSPGKQGGAIEAFVVVLTCLMFLRRVRRDGGDAAPCRAQDLRPAGHQSAGQARPRGSAHSAPRARVRHPLLDHSGAVDGHRGRPDDPPTVVARVADVRHVRELGPWRRGRAS